MSAMASVDRSPFTTVTNGTGTTAGVPDTNGTTGTNRMNTTKVTNKITGNNGTNDDNVTNAKTLGQMKKAAIRNVESLKEVTRARVNFRNNNAYVSVKLANDRTNAGTNAGTNAMGANTEDVRDNGRYTGSWGIRNNNPSGSNLSGGNTPNHQTNTNTGVGTNDWGPDNDAGDNVMRNNAYHEASSALDQRIADQVRKVNPSVQHVYISYGNRVDVGQTRNMSTTNNADILPLNTGNQLGGDNTNGNGAGRNWSWFGLLGLLGLLGLNRNRRKAD